MGRCWLWGAGPPQTFSAQVGYLPGLSVWSLHVLPVCVCVEFACSPRVHKGFPPLRTPNRRTEHMSIPDQRWTVHLTWSPGAAQLPTAPGGSLRKDVPGWEKAEDKFTATSGLRVCVSCVAYIYIYVCVCAIKTPDKLLHTHTHTHIILHPS